MCIRWPKSDFFIIITFFWYVFHALFDALKLWRFSRRIMMTYTTHIPSYLLLKNHHHHLSHRLWCGRLKKFASQVSMAKGLKRINKAASLFFIVRFWIRKPWALTWLAFVWSLWLMNLSVVSFVLLH